MIGRAAATPVLRVAALEGVPLVREGLRTVIEQATGLGWIGATNDPGAIRANLIRLGPDVVIADSALDPVGDLTRYLAKSDPGLTVVIMIGDHRRTSELVSTAQAAGAHGLVRRGAPPACLVSAIRRAHHTRWFVDPGLSMVEVRPRARAGRRDGPDVLSARQRQVLGMIAGGMSSADIAQTLVVSPETVRTHIKQVLRRLDARDRAHAVARAYHLGLLHSSGVGRNGDSDDSAVKVAAR